MHFRKSQKITAVLDRDTSSKPCCDCEISKHGKTKGNQKNPCAGSMAKSFGGSTKMTSRCRSTGDLKSKTFNFDINDIPPLRPLKGCLSNGSLSSLPLMGNQECESENRIKRSVSFGNLIIREHPRTFSGMSNCGPLLTLDWYDESESTECGIQCRTIEVSVDEYENTREPRRPRPPLVSSAKRERLLKKFGITDDDLLIAEKQRNAEKEASKKHDSKILDVVGKAVRKTLKAGSSEVQKELDTLMKRSAEAEQMKKIQIEKYLMQQRMQILERCEAQIKNEQLQMCFSDETEATNSCSSSDSFVVHDTEEFALVF